MSGWVIRLVIRVRRLVRPNLKMEWFNFEWTIRLTLSANFDGQFEDGLSVSDSLCTAAPSPSEKIGEGMSVGEGEGGTTVPRLSETDNPSSNCPSKLAGKVRRMVHSKLKPFHFQIKTYYLSDANYQTDNPSVMKNPSLVCKWMSRPALSWSFACLLLLFHKDYF